MVRSLLATGLVVSAVIGGGYVGLRTLGEDVKAPFDELNSALEKNLPREGKASAEDAAAWIERYRAGARAAECRERSEERRVGKEC